MSDEKPALQSNQIFYHGMIIDLTPDELRRFRLAELELNERLAQIERQRRKDMADAYETLEWVRDDVAQKAARRMLAEKPENDDEFESWSFSADNGN